MFVCVFRFLFIAQKEVDPLLLRSEGFLDGAAQGVEEFRGDMRGIQGGLDFLPGFFHLLQLAAEKFVAFELPDDIKKEYGVDLTPQVKRKVLGENAARLYGIDIAEHKKRLMQDPIGVRLREQV